MVVQWDNTDRMPQDDLDLPAGIDITTEQANGAEHRPPVCVPNGHSVRCPAFEISGLQAPLGAQTGRSMFRSWCNGTTPTECPQDDLDLPAGRPELERDER